MQFDAINVGDRAELIVAGYPKTVYRTKVTNILDEGERVLSIYVPTLSGRNLRMTANQDYIISVFTNHSIIRFICVFEGYVKEDLNIFVAIRIVDTGEKIQRREFFRFTCMLAMKFSVIDYGDNEAAKILHSSGHVKHYDAIVRDIGGGGIRFITVAELAMDNSIECTILLGSTTLKANGQLLEKQYMPKSTMKYQYRALFYDLSPTVQEEIINYIFVEQRRQRKINIATTLKD